MVGALFVPWPNEQKGLILHSRQGAGSFIENSPIKIAELSAYRGLQLAGFPASLGLRYSLSQRTGNTVSDARTTGSIAYELAMVSQGIFEYTVHTNPRIWDVAGGIAILTEAGGECIAKDNNNLDRENSHIFLPSWRSGETTLQQVRDWSIKSLVSGRSGINEKSANLLKSRSKLGYFLSSRVKRLL